MRQKFSFSKYNWNSFSFSFSSNNTTQTSPPAVRPLHFGTSIDEPSVKKLRLKRRRLDGQNSVPSKSLSDLDKNESLSKLNYGQIHFKLDYDFTSNKVCFLQLFNYFE